MCFFHLFHSLNYQTVYRRQGRKGATTKPVVFVHGIGAGLIVYSRFLANLPRETTVYVLEWTHISMTLGAEDAPCIDQTVEMLHTMLSADGHADALFVGHSLGTIVISWLLRGDRASRSLVYGAVMIDPIGFLLSEPSVVYNFIHRTPSDSVELMMHYFVARELYIANTLSRQFSWSHAVLFAEDLPPGENLVVLSGADAIVPAQLVRAYLQKCNEKTKRTEIIWHPDMHHGSIVLNVGAIKEICIKINEMITV